MNQLFLFWHEDKGSLQDCWEKKMRTNMWQAAFTMVPMFSLSWYSCLCIIPSPWVWAGSVDSFLMNRNRIRQKAMERLGFYLVYSLLLSCSNTLNEVSCHVMSCFGESPCGEEMICIVHSWWGPEATNNHMSDLGSGPPPLWKPELEVPS